MLRAVRFVTLATTICAAQEPKPATVMEGVALDAATRAPLAGATVALSPADTAADAITTVTGGFRFAGIPAGKYRVSAKLDGYREAARFVEAKPGTEQEKITLALTPLSSISGRVLDENGAPVAGVVVTAGAGHKAETDAAGRYRLEDLSTGEYRLKFRPPIAMRRETAEKNEKTGEVFGYADRIYYPGVNDAGAAAPVTVGSRIPVDGIDIKLKRTLLVEISGRVLDKATGQPLPNADIELVAGGDRLERKPAGTGGAFTFELVPPGFYEVLLRREGAASYDNPAYRTALNVGQHGLSGAELRIPEYVTLTVNILPHIDWPVRGTLQIVRGVGSSGFSCNFGSGEICLIRDVPPGPFRLMIGANVLPWDVRGRPADSNSMHKFLEDARAARRSFHVKSIRFGGQDAAGMTIMVAEGANPPIDLTFTDQAGTIAATVLDEDGQDAEAAAFRLSRVDGDLSIPVPDVGVRSSYSPFSIAGLIPGEYWIAAFPAPDNGSPVRTVAPEECGDRAARVMVTDRQTTAVTLHPCMVR